MQANYYIEHPTDGTSVDLYIEWNNLEDRWPTYYKVLDIWDPTGTYIIDPAIYDLSWLTKSYIQDNYQSWQQQN